MPIIEKRCLRCQSVFTCWQRPNGEQVYCGTACADQARGEKLRRPVKAPPPTATSECRWCGATFEHPRAKRRMYCSKRCASRARMATTDLRERIVARARAKTPRQRAVLSARMRRLNADPAI